MKVRIDFCKSCLKVGVERNGMVRLRLDLGTGRLRSWKMLCRGERAKDLWGSAMQRMMRWRAYSSSSANLSDLIMRLASKDALVLEAS